MHAKQELCDSDPAASRNELESCVVMNSLLEQKRTLEKELLRLRESCLEGDPDARMRFFDLSSDLMRRIRGLNQRIAACRTELTKLLSEVLAEVNTLAQAGRNEQISELVKIFLHVPQGMYSPEGLNLEALRHDAHAYQVKHRKIKGASHFDYAAALDQLCRSLAREGGSS